MASDMQTLRRIVLGVGGSGNARELIETGTTLAAAFKSELYCLLVEQEDLINLASLPFARTVAPGGLVSAITPQSMAAHFDRLFRDVQRDLALLCSPANVTWQLQRPLGEFFHELTVFLEAGDTVIVSREEIKRTRRPALATIRELLSVAGAVVLPARRPKKVGPIVALGGGRSLDIARAIAQPLGLAARPVSLLEAGRLKGPASVIVASISEAERIDESTLFGFLTDTGAMAVILANGLKDDEQPSL